MHWKKWTFFNFLIVLVFTGFGGYERALNVPELTADERSKIGIIPKDLIQPLYGVNRKEIIRIWWIS